MRASSGLDRLRLISCVAALMVALQTSGQAEDLPIVVDVEFQPSGGTGKTHDRGTRDAGAAAGPR